MHSAISRPARAPPRIVWGRNDPLILPAAAEFVKQVVPAADLRYFDAGHFALDENADAIVEAIINGRLRRQRTLLAQVLWTEVENHGAPSPCDTPVGQSVRTHFFTGF